MKPLAFLRQKHKLVPKKIKDEINISNFENPDLDDRFRILNKNLAELDCLKKVFTSVYCKCPVCSKTECHEEK